MSYGSVVPLLQAVTAVGTGQGVKLLADKRTLQASLTAGTATVQVEGSNDNTWPGVVLGTITLGGSNPLVDGFASDAPWPYLRGNVTAISGGGTLNLTVGQ